MEAIIERPTRQDQEVALKSLVKYEETAKKIAREASDVVSIKLQEGGRFITIPKKAVELLFRILSGMAEGKAISLMPADAEVSTQQAADLLNVSRPHVVKLLESGHIPFRKVGSHRRILLEDLMKYDQEAKEQRDKSLAFLAQQAQELNLGYE
jgi:excisionase family DNA binding protein